MAKKAASTTTSRPSARRAAGKTAEASAAEDAFTRSLVTHGQAAKAGPDGRLPPGATHELVEDPDGRTRAVRKRFSAL